MLPAWLCWCSSFRTSWQLLGTSSVTWLPGGWALEVITEKTRKDPLATAVHCSHLCLFWGLSLHSSCITQDPLWDTWLILPLRLGPWSCRVIPQWSQRFWMILAAHWFMIKLLSLAAIGWLLHVSSSLVKCCQVERSGCPSRTSGMPWRPQLGMFAELLASKRCTQTNAALKNDASTLQFKPRKHTAMQSRLILLKAKYLVLPGIDNVLMTGYLRVGPGYPWIS